MNGCGEVDTIQDAVEKALQKCDICMAGNIISRERLLRTYSDFVLSTMEKEKHNVGMILHTGSACFDVFLIVCAALSNILYNQTATDDVIASLTPGDKVLYYSGKEKIRAQRYTFCGFVNSYDDPPSEKIGKLILLDQGKNGKTYLMKQNWSGIVPYFGESASLDGKGIRKENGKRKSFFCDVLGMKDSEIPRTIDTSTVVVMSKEDADNILNRLTFWFSNMKVALTELVPISYYTDADQEYPYGNNPAKTEPVIKITGKVSVARSLLLDRSGNRNIGLMVLGDEAVRRGESELPELIERKSLQYVYLSMPIGSESSAKMVDRYSSAAVFACTKDFLLCNYVNTAISNQETDILNAQIDAIIDKEVTTIVLPSLINWESYKEFKNAMYFIKSEEYSTDKKDEFIIHAYSLMKLFMTAAFSIQCMEKMIDDSELENVIKPDERLTQITEYSHTFPDHLKSKAETIINILEIAYLSFFDKNPKEKALKELLEKTSATHIAIVVPKAYYIKLMQWVLSEDEKLCNRDWRIDIVTANRFDNSNMYDLIIAVGNITGNRFDILRCQASKNITAILYEAEKHQFYRNEKRFKSVEHMLNQRSAIHVDDDYENESSDVDESEIATVEKIDDELSEYFDSVAIKAVRNSADYASRRNVADIVAVAKFDTDEVAFFTKNYKAYVLDDLEHTIKEVPADSIVEGDTIVFTRSNSRTRDIVEKLLRDMITNNLVSDNVKAAYKQSRRWKTVLIDYMNNTGSTPVEIANQMIKNGVTVQEHTIKSWLDEEAHTVRPKKLDSIQQIALIAGDEDLFDHAEECFAAGGVIYKIRRQILTAIGQTILGEITGNDEQLNPITATIADRIKESAVVVQVESISFVNDTVPLNSINRPISID